jgi:hypothetical protein
MLIKHQWHPKANGSQANKVVLAARMLAPQLQPQMTSSVSDQRAARQQGQHQQHLQLQEMGGRHVKQQQQLWQQHLLQMLPLLLHASHVSRQGMRCTPPGPALLGQGCWQLHSQSLQQREGALLMQCMLVDLPPLLHLAKGKVTEVLQGSKAVAITRAAAAAEQKRQQLRALQQALLQELPAMLLLLLAVQGAKPVLRARGAVLPGTLLAATADHEQEAATRVRVIAGAQHMVTAASSSNSNGSSSLVVQVESCNALN